MHPNTVWLHASIGYVTLTTSTKDEAKRSVRPAATDSPPRANRIAYCRSTTLRRTSDPEPPVAGYYHPVLA